MGTPVLRPWAIRLAGILPRDLLRNASWVASSNVAAVAIGFLNVVALSRLLGPGDYGRMVGVLGTAGLVFGLVEPRLQDAVMRYVAEFHEAGDWDRLVATVKLSLLADVATGLAAFGAVLACAPVLAERVAESPDARLLLLLGGLVLLAGNVTTTTSYGLLRIFDGFKYSAIVTVCGQVLRLVAGVVAVTAFHAGAAGALVAAALAGLASTAALGAGAAHQLRSRRPEGLPRGEIRLLRPRLGEMSRVVASTWATAMTTIPLRTLDVTLLAVFRPAATVGAYGVAKNAMTLAWSIGDPLLFVIYPDFARRFARGDLEGIRALARRLAGVLGLVGLAASVGACFVVPAVLPLVVGPDFEAAGSTFRWMAWSFAAWLPLLWTHPLLSASGRPDLMLRASVVTALITLVGYVMVVPAFGAPGAAFLYGMGVALNSAIAAVLIRREGVLRGDAVAAGPPA